MFIVEGKRYQLTKADWAWRIVLVLLIAPGILLTIHMRYRPDDKRR